jgi:hypothetical protein
MRRLQDSHDSRARGAANTFGPSDGSKNQRQKKLCQLCMSVCICCATECVLLLLCICLVCLQGSVMQLIVHSYHAPPCQ